jgi:hypothetical protein
MYRVVVDYKKVSLCEAYEWCEANISPHNDYYHNQHKIEKINPKTHRKCLITELPINEVIELGFKHDPSKPWAVFGITFFFINKSDAFAFKLIFR